MDDPSGRAAVAAPMAHEAVRVTVGLILLAAAALKGHELATQPVVARTVLESRWFLIVLVEAELVLGLLLLAAAWRRAVWLAALVGFVVFSGASLVYVLQGKASCGCFGRVTVDPRLTLALDVAVVLALAVFRPRGEYGPMRRSRWRLVATAVLMLALGVPGGLAMAPYKPATLSSGEQLESVGGLVLLEPKSWIGKPFPLTDYIDVGPVLTTGSWYVVLYHHDCPACREALPMYQSWCESGRGAAGAGAAGAARVAFVEVPPYGPDVLGGAPPGGCVRGKLDDRYDWFVTSPAVVLVESGKVVAASEGEPLPLP